MASTCDLLVFQDFISTLRQLNCNKRQHLIYNNIIMENVQAHTYKKKKKKSMALLYISKSSIDTFFH